MDIPDIADKNLKRGYKLFARRDFDGAMKAFNKGIARNPSFLAYYSRGIIYQAQGDCDRAIADFNYSLHLEPGHSHVHLARGDAYYTRAQKNLSLFDFWSAIADYTMVIDSDPEYARKAYLMRGHSYYRTHAYGKALADFNLYLELGPSGQFVYFLRGSTYHEMGEYEKALADFNESRRMGNDDMAVYEARGDTYAKLGDDDRAIADYNEVIKRDPEYCLGYKERGDAWARKGEFVRAIADFESVLRINPDDGESKRKLDILRTARDNDAQAKP